MFGLKGESYMPEIYILVILLGVLVAFIYLLCQDVLNPALIFAIVFFLAAANLATNINSVGVTLHIDTVIYILVGVLAFFIGSIVVSKTTFRISSNGYFRFKYFSGRHVHLPKKKMLIILVFNMVGCAYIMYDVYSLVKNYVGYIGNILGAAGTFATYSKYGDMGLQISGISNILVCVLETESYVIGYIIATNLAKKRKTDLITILCFVTSFISTFCMGSRGGVLIIISIAFMFIMQYRLIRSVKHISMKLVRRMIMVVIFAIIVFQISGTLAQKNWDVPFYEYLSVYVGFPIYNFDVAFNNGIVHTDIFGAASFGGLYKNFLSDFETYTNFRTFLHLNGHNMGNVYTIFATLTADFGNYGSMIALFVIGFLMQVLYNSAKKDKEELSVKKIVCAFFLVCTAFSFFSNKICEAIIVWRFYWLVFLYIWKIVLTSKKGEHNNIDI